MSRYIVSGPARTLSIAPCRESLAREVIRHAPRALAVGILALSSVDLRAQVNRPPAWRDSLGQRQGPDPR